MPPYVETTVGLDHVSGATPETAYDALLAASLEIDAAFGAAGYIVPLDATAITNTDLQERFAAWLKQTCTKLARQSLSDIAPRHRGQTPKGKKDKDRAEATLERIRTGVLYFSFLPRVRKAGVRVAGGVEWRATPALYDLEDAVHALG